MANIGEAHVDINATTDKVRSQVSDGVTKGMAGVGTEAGKTFTKDFEAESNRGIAGVAARLGSRLADAIERSGGDSGKRFANQFRNAAQAIGGQRIKAPDLDTSLLQAKIAQVSARIDALGKKKASAKVDADTAIANIQLAKLEARLAALTRDKKTINLDIDRSLTQSLISVSALARAIGTLSLPVVALGATPAIASLGASAVQAAGSLYLLPAATATAALGIGTLVTGFQGLGDALGPTGTPAQVKKVNEALASLSPQARATVTEIRALSDEWLGLRQAVQDRLFQGISDDIGPLASTYMPMLRAAMVQVAGGFNQATTEMITFLRSNEGITDMRSGLNNTAVATTTLTGVIAPLGRAILDIFVVGSGYVRQYAGSIVDLAVKFEQWIAQARASGELNRIIEQAIVVIGQLLQLAGNLIGILRTVFQAGQDSAGSFLQTLVMVTGEVNAFLRSAEGNAALVALFKAIHDTAKAMMPGLLALGAAIAQSIIVLEPVLPKIGEAFSALAIAAQPFIVSMASFAATVLPPVIAAISEFAPILGPAIAAFGALYLATSALGSMIAVFNSINKVVRIVTVAKIAWAAAQWLVTAAVTALTSPIGLVVVAIGALVAGLVYAYQNSETFRRVVDEAFAAVKTAVISVIDWFKQLPDRIREAVSAAGQWFGGLYDSAVETGSRVVEWITNLPTMIGDGLSSLGATITSAASNAWDGLVSGTRTAIDATLRFLAELPGNIAYGLGYAAGVVVREGVRVFWGLVDGAIAAGEAVYNFFDTLPERLGAFFTTLGTSIYNWAAAAWNRYTDAIVSAFTAVGDFLDAAPAIIGRFFTDLGTSIYTWAVGAYRRWYDAIVEEFAAIQAFLESLPARIGTFFTNLGSSIYNWAVNAYRRWYEALVSEWAAIQAFFEGLPARIGAFFAAAGQWLYQAGADILNGLVNGLTSAWNAVWSWLGEMTGKFIQGFKDALGIASPSTLFAQFGTWILEGFLNGLTTMVQTIMAFVSSFVDRFISGFDNLLTMFAAIWQAILDTVRTILDAIVTFVSTGMDNLSNFVTTVMNAVASFWSSIWNAISQAGQAIFGAYWNYFQNALNNLWSFIQQILNLVRAFWESIWNAISAFGRQIWDALVAFYNSGFTNWRGLFEALMNAVNALWQNVWNIIEAFGRAIWTTIVNFFQAGFNNFLALVTSIMNAVLAFWQSVWTAIRTFAETVWNAFRAFIDAGLAALRTLVETVMNAIRAGWESIWTAIRTFGETAWRNFQTFITGGLATFKTGWDNFWSGISTGFQRIWEGIQAVARTAWENLNNNFRGGINLVIDAVNWPINKINSVFGISIPTIARLATGGTIDVEGIAGLARGGQRPGKVNGPGSNTSDGVLTKLSRNEHVWSAAEVNAAGGHDAVRRMRAQVMAGAGHSTAPGTLAGAMASAGMNPDSLGNGAAQGYRRRKMMDKYPQLDDVGLQMLAYGGVMNHVAAAGDEITRVFGRMPGGIGGVGARGNVSDHPRGLALDFMTMNNLGLGDRVEQYLYNNARRLSVKYNIFRQRIRYPGGGWRGMEDRGSATANHMDHVHTSFMAVPGMVGTDPGGGGLIQRIMPSFDGILEGAKSALGGLMGGRVGWWKDLGASFLDKAWEGMKRKATDLWNAVTATIGGTVSGAGAALGLSGPVQQQVQRVASERGWGTGAEWSALSSIIQRESGWNPNAQNPTSTAYGLFQFLNGTWASTGVAKTNNPEMQARAGMQYIASRYGTPTGAKAFWDRNGWYDRGGWLLPGTTLATNNTGKKEAIIADPMTTFERSFKNIFRWLAPQMESALSTTNGAAFDAIVRRLGGEKELGKDLGRLFDKLPRTLQEAIRTQYPTISKALDSKDVDLVDAIRDIIVVPPVTVPAPPVIPPVEVPPVVVPKLPTGEIGLSFTDALRQFAPDLSLALKAGATDQTRALAQDIIGNNERLAAISAAMGSDVRPVLQNLIDSLKPKPVVVPKPPVPQIPVPTWLEREVERMRQYALANLNKANNAGDRLEQVGDDFSWRLVRAFEAAFPNIETATETSRIDVNRTLAAEANDILTWLQGRTAAEQVEILEALDGQDRSLAEALKAAQATVKVETKPAPAGLTIADGAFQVTIEGNADSVTVDQLRNTLVAWSDEILTQYEART